MHKQSTTAVIPAHRFLGSVETLEQMAAKMIGRPVKLGSVEIAEVLDARYDPKARVFVISIFPKVERIDVGYKI